MNINQIKTFEEAVAYLNSTPRFTSKHTMEETKDFLQLLGNPDQKLKMIHVAGTNGKGSVCAYLRYILEAAGFRVGLFTSPHLVDIRERFVIGGEMISKEAFLWAFHRIFEKIEDYHPTYFEYLFFMGMLLFEREAPDYVILETGLGGRLDATNSVAHKELSVITRISLDHVQYLGDTVAKIAVEKAGIMMTGVPAVCNGWVEDAKKVFLQNGEELGCPVFLVDENDICDVRFHKKHIDFSMMGRYDDTIAHSPEMSCQLDTIAAYQVENAAIAVRSAQVLFARTEVENPAHAISEEDRKNAICEGLRKCHWQGRMEEILPNVYVDGAHNEDGIRAFLETVSKDVFFGERWLLFSAVSDKDYQHMIGELVEAKLFSRIAVTRLETERAADTERLEAIFASYGDDKIQIFDHATQALSVLVSDKKEDCRIYVAGSLYLVGEIKAFFGERYD